jgi:hypothetical protein
MHLCKASYAPWTWVEYQHCHSNLRRLLLLDRYPQSWTLECIFTKLRMRHGLG